MPFSANASSIISVFLMSTVLSSRAAAKKHGQVSAVTNSFGQGMPGAQRSATLDKSNLVSSSLHLRYSAASRSLHNSFLNTDKKHLDKTRARAQNRPRHKLPLFSLRSDSVFCSPGQRPVDFIVVIRYSVFVFFHPATLDCCPGRKILLNNKTHTRRGND